MKASGRNGLDKRHAHHRQHRSQMANDDEDLFLGLVIKRRNILSHVSNEVDGLLIFL